MVRKVPQGGFDCQPVRMGATAGDKHDPSGLQILLLVLYFSICSGFMLIFNKLVISVIDAPTLICFAQVGFAAAVVRVLQVVSILPGGGTDLNAAMKFLPVALGFQFLLYASFKILQQTSVETFIALRSSAPLALSVMDYWFLNRELPSKHSVVCLVALLAGTLGFAYFEGTVSSSAWLWLVSWFAAFCGYEVYTKFVVDSFHMSNWDRVYLTNVLATPAFLVVGIMLGESPEIYNLQLISTGSLFLALCCLCSVAISHSAYCLREAVSNTWFSVIGILCKLLTVLANVLIFAQHSGPEALACLILSILAGSLYKQAPLRNISVHDVGKPLLTPKPPTPPTTNSAED